MCHICCREIPKQGNTAEITLTALHRNFLGVDEFLGTVSIPLAEFDVYERPRNRLVSQIFRRSNVVEFIVQLDIVGWCGNGLEYVVSCIVLHNVLFHSPLPFLTSPPFLSASAV